jgi:O-antigen biosynthesis protein WbqP
MRYSFIKRSGDILAVLTLFLVISPILLIIAICIKFYDGGPIIFKQNRMGRDGAEFKFMKFRSMSVDTPIVVSTQTAVLKVTPIGKFIRRTNLDEIPQFINVLNGDMSIIGPRPSLPSQTALLDLRKQNGSIKLRPGLTGWAQVNAYDYMPEEEKASLDGEYYQKFSLWMDLRIILGTIKYFTKKPPVY